MTKYFLNITADLDLKRDSEILSDTSTSVSSILERFYCLQSILKIQEGLIRLIIFSFMRYVKTRFEGSCIIKLKVSWKISYRNYLQDSEKIIVPKTV